VSQIKNKDIKISVLHNKETEINWGSNKLAGPKIIAELFKSYFIEIVGEMTE
jgi:hypothetical protein